MKIMGLLASGLVFGAGLSVTYPAYADIPPPDSCSSLGDTCSTAGPAFDQPGTCKRSECTRATPGGPMTYECNRCVAADEGGAGGAGGAGGDTATGGADVGGAPPASTGGVRATGGSPPVSTGGASATGGTVSATGGTASATGGTKPITGGSKGDAGSGGAVNPGKKDDDGGCSIGNVGQNRNVGAFVFGLGMAGLLAARRRR